MTYLVIGLIWLFGAVAASKIISVAGLKCPKTYGDSWSGDDTIDLWAILLWPLTLFVVLAWKTGGVISRLVIG